MAQLTPDQLPSYRLGDIRVEPARNLLRADGKTFRIEPRVMGVLSVLVAQAGQVVTRESLLSKLWNIDYGGDESLTRAISILRKTFREAGSAADIIETVPKRGYRLAAEVQTWSKDGPPLVNAEPPVAAVVHNIPVDGVLPGGAPSTGTSKQYWIAGLALLLVAGFVYIDSGTNADPHLQRTESVTVPIPRVRIAPFEILDDAHGHESFALNLRSELSSLLLANNVLSTFEDSHGEQTQKLALMGTIEGANQQLRVRIQLIDQPSQLVLWTKVFGRDYAAATHFETAIAARTTSLVSCILQWRPDAIDTAANTLALYSQFCDALRSVPWARPQLTLVEPIYTADPDSENAKSLYAYALHTSAAQDPSLIPETRQAYRNQGDALLAEVLATQPQSALANFARAQALSTPEHWAEIEAHLVTATTQSKVPDLVYAAHSAFLRRVGRLQAATAIYERLAIANPANIFAQTRLGFLMAAIGEDRTAERQFALAKQLDPDWDALYQRQIQIDLFWGDPNDALARLAEDPPDSYGHATYYSKCYTAFARARLSANPDLPALSETCASVGRVWPFRMFALLGDLDRTFEVANDDQWLERGGSVMAFFYPDVADVRRDPRFWALAEKTGLVTYWYQSKRWPDFCETEKLPEPCEASAKRLLGL